MTKNLHNTPLPGGSKLIALPAVCDQRGMLTFGEGGQHIPFRIARMFWIQNVPAGMSRGGHAHRTCAEVVVAVVGAFTMTVDDGAQRQSVRMDSPQKGILIPAGVWCELTDFEPGTICVVAASEEYDATGYVHDYATYLDIKGNNVKS